MNALDTRARDAVLDRLERERFDCVVIGGGISGAGLARQAALRGLSVALLEAEDFASGTSSRSSKLVHGGLRYLAMGDVALVRKTARERKEIFRLAPHLAEPRWLVVPTRSYAGLLKMRTAIITYERLGGVAAADRHHNWSAHDLAREEPGIDRTVFKHAVAYREYLTDDAHLVLANLRAAAGDGAALLNHATVDTVLRQDGVASGVEAVCRLSGRRVAVRARCVVNAAGPWVEAVRRLEDAAAPPLLHLSKGVHVAVRAERLPVRNMVLCNTADKRSIFVISHGAVVYLGTTDTTYEPGAEVWPAIAHEDVEYLLEPLSRYFGVEIRAAEIVGAWAGLRPLIAEPGKEPRELSRREEILVGPARVVTLAGGKLTGYRVMARECLERAAAVAGLEPAPAREEPPLPGGDFDGDLDALEARLRAETGLGRATAARLVRLYGSEARAVAARGVEPLVEGGPVLASEVDWAIEMEGAATLEDVIYRRLRTALYTPDARAAAPARAAARMAERLGWDPRRTAREVEQVEARQAADLAFAGSGLQRFGSRAAGGAGAAR